MTDGSSLAPPEMAPAQVPLRIWTALVLPPVAWSIQGLAIWFVGSRICGALSVRGARVAVSLLTLTAVACAIWAVRTGYRGWSASGRRWLPRDGMPIEFVSFLAYVCGAMFAVATILAAFSMGVVGGCGGV
jgi:hypothetical protein